MGQNHSHLQPEDLIEINRPLHQHWAIYMGDGYVIHLAPVGKQDQKLGVHKVPVFTRKVKNERLNKVGKKKQRVNNESDQYNPPLPVKEIIKRAEGYIDKEVTYRVFGSNCEHFVKKLRYGDQLRALVGGGKHLRPTTDDKDYPKPGDLIEIERAGYQHWALYVGIGYVINVTTIDENAPPMSAGSVTLVTKRAKVKKELLMKVVRNDDWDIDNKYDYHHIPFPTEEIIRRAERWIDKEVPYDVLGSNCEHFVTELRYGEGVSDQAWRALGLVRSITAVATVAGIASSASLLPVSMPVAVIAGTGIGALLNRSALFNTIDRLRAYATFRMAPRDIVEQRCC